MLEKKENILLPLFLPNETAEENITAKALKVFLYFLYTCSYTLQKIEI